jgi:hypothetical protein
MGACLLLGVVLKVTKVLGYFFNGKSYVSILTNCWASFWATFSQTGYKLGRECYINLSTVFCCPLFPGIPAHPFY